MRWLRVVSSVLLGVVALAALGMRPAVGQQLPNVLFILYDDVGFADFGSYGNTYIPTPDMDAVAAEGMLFTNYYAPAAACSPSRAATLTGMSPSRFGFRGTLPGSSTRGIPDYVMTLGQLMQQAGYATGHVGKWHLGTQWPEYVPINRGFDSDVRFGSKFAALTSYWDPVITIDDAYTVAHEGHLTDILTDYAIAFIEEHQSEPFFLNFWLGAAHEPLEPKPEWDDLFEDTPEGDYAALLAHASEQTGRLLARLDELGLTDNTLVIITSDHGGVSSYHDHAPEDGPSNGGYADGKGGVLDGGLRAPFLVRWPGVVAPGSVDDSVIVGFDVFPTLAELTGIDVSERGLDGESFLGVLTGGGGKPRSGPFYGEIKDESEYFESEIGILDSFFVRDGEWKAACEDQSLRLYDLALDPFESANLFAELPETAAYLLAEYEAWRLETGTIPHAVDFAVGDVTIEGDLLTFGEGRVNLVRNTLYNVDDADFSFVAEVTPSELNHTAMLALYGKVWRFQILRSGQVLLKVFGSGGESTELRSTTRVAPGETHQLGFSIYAWKQSPSTVRLFVDGVVEAETNEIDSVLVADDIVLLGNTPQGNAAFVGTMESPRFLVLAPTVSELAMLRQ